MGLAGGILPDVPPAGRRRAFILRSSGLRPRTRTRKLGGRTSRARVDRASKRRSRDYRRPRDRLRGGLRQLRRRPLTAGPAGRERERAPARPGALRGRAARGHARRREPSHARERELRGHSHAHARDDALGPGVARRVAPSRRLQPRLPVASPRGGSTRGAPREPRLRGGIGGVPALELERARGGHAARHPESARRRPLPDRLAARGDSRAFAPGAARSRADRGDRILARRAHHGARGIPPPSCATRACEPRYRSPDPARSSRRASSRSHRFRCS